MRATASYENVLVALFAENRLSLTDTNGTQTPEFLAREVARNEALPPQGAADRADRARTFLILEKTDETATPEDDGEAIGALGS